MAMVLWPGVAGNEAGIKLARPGKILPQIRRGDWCAAASGGSVVRVESLAAPDQRSAVGITVDRTYALSHKDFGTTVFAIVKS